MGAYVTVIGPSDAQVDYRLTGGCGCGPDAALGYYLDAPERPLRWIGRGGAALGLPAGAVLDPAGYDAARAVMGGVHPGTGEMLVTPKTATAPAALLPGVPLLDAVLLEATRRRVSPQGLWTTGRAAEEWGRLARGVARRGAAHRIPVARAARLLDAAGLTPEAAYDTAVFDAAACHASERVVVGNRGYDLTLTLPKSFSVLAAFADPATSARLEGIFWRAGQDTLAYAEQVAGYGMRGHHGGGRTARRVDGRGFVGWVTVHRTARPTTPGVPGDPHLHSHFAIANLVQGVDGRWSTVAAGGRDLLAHARVLGEFVTARARRLTIEELDLSWTRDPVSGQWEITGISSEAIGLFSKRGVQVAELLAELGLTPHTATPAQHRIAGRATRQAKHPDAASIPDGGLRQYWRAEATAAGIDPERLAAAVHAARAPTPARPDDDTLARAVFDPHTGVTAHTAWFTRADLLAALADALPDGLAGAADLDALTDQILTRPEAVPLPPRPGVPVHLSNTARYTTADLVAASTRIIEATTAGLHTDTAVVPPVLAAHAEQAHQAANGHPLSTEQRAVYHRLVTAGHRVEVVIGVAGSGKTTVAATARAAWQSAGLTVRGAALAAVGADNLRDAGIPATTIASLLHPDRPTADTLAGIDVLVIDEASQVGVRDLDTLLAAAARSGTKIVQIGDPHQLGSPAPGGALAAQHRVVTGLTLTENRRQYTTAARRAAAWWRAGNYPDALAAWRATGGAVTTETRAQALRAALTGWVADRAGYPDRHARVDNVLLLAVRNIDIAELNTAARALAQATGQLTGPDRVYRLTAGGTLPLAVGDVVMTRINDYRAWRGTGPDVLNGRRGYVDHIDPNTGAVTITWRSTDQIGHSTLTADYITAGGLEHGYAITVYKAQGHTADTTHTYGAGLDAHTTYVAQTRARHHATLYLPAAALADPTEHTPDDITAMTPAEQADLAASAVTHAAEHTTEQHLVTEELGRTRPTRTGYTAATGPVPEPLRSTPATPEARSRRAYLAALDTDLRHRLDADPALPALLARLDQAAGHGHDPARLLAALAARHDLDTANSAAKVLHWRVERWLDQHHPTPDGHAQPPAANPSRSAAGRLHNARSRASHMTVQHAPEETAPPPEPRPGTESHPRPPDPGDEQHAGVPEDTAEAT